MAAAIPERFPILGQASTQGAELGGKGDSLDRLARAGLPVPWGFGVPAECFRAGMRRPGAAPALRRLAAVLARRTAFADDRLLEAYPELQGLEQELNVAAARTLGFLRQYRSIRCVVRSSATGEDGRDHSFAGLLRSFLPVASPAVGRCILLCWAAVHDERFRSYCSHHELDADGVAVGVVVQELVPARAAGVLLTHDPVTGDPGPLVDAVRGLGGGLVGGDLAPWHYRRLADGSWSAEPGAQRWEERLEGEVLRRRPLEAVDQRRPLLSPAELERLARLARRAEGLFDGPQDLEWALAGRRLWLIQARPITSLAPPGRVWTRANFKEMYPELPSPMITSLMERHKSGWLRQQFLSMGFPVADLGPAVRVIRGRLYFNRTLLEALPRSLGFRAEAVQASVGGAGAGTPVQGLCVDWPALLRSLPRLLRLLGRYVNTPRRARAIVAAAGAVAGRLGNEPAELLEDARLVDLAVYAFRAAEGLDGMASDVMGAINLWTLAARALLRGVVASPNQFVAATTVSGEENPTARQVREMERLVELARRDPVVQEWFRNSTGALRSPACRSRVRELGETEFGRALEEFLRQFGTRAVHESDSAVPRFDEHPGPLLRAVRAALRSGPDRVHEGLEDRMREREREAWTELRAGLAWWERLLPLRPLAVRLLMARLRLLYALREEVRLGITRVIAQQRRLELTLGERWRSRQWLARAGDYFLLRVEEAERAAADPESGGDGWLRRRVARRRELLASWAAQPAPDLWVDGRAETSAPAVPEGATALRGLPLSPGVADGRVAHVRGPEDVERVPAGAILVAPTVGPSWTPLFVSARGVIVEMAGMLSHGAILVREYGLPAVANVPGITRLLVEGERVRVDGSRGLIQRLEQADGTNPRPDQAPGARADGLPREEDAGCTSTGKH